MSEYSFGNLQLLKRDIFVYSDESVFIDNTIRTV